MKMCDRCSVPGCCLEYRGEACENARKQHCPDVKLNNAEYLSDIGYEELAEALVYMVCDLYEDGIPSKYEVMEWLESPADYY